MVGISKEYQAPGRHSYYIPGVFRFPVLNILRAHEGIREIEG